MTTLNFVQLVWKSFTHHTFDAHNLSKMRVIHAETGKVVCRFEVEQQHCATICRV
jgi:stress response protein SCP2